MSVNTNRGIRLPQQKEPAASRAVGKLNQVERVILPLSYGVEGGQPACGLYETVMRGSLLVKPESPEELPVAASVTGVFSGTRVIRHPLYGELECAVIDVLVAEGDEDGKPASLDKLTPDKVLKIARDAGIVDELDGVPLYTKLSQWREQGCDFLVADGTQPEPYASSAWAVLNLSAERVQDGLELAASCVGASGFHTAVFLPPERRRPLAQRLGENRLFQVPNRYPVTKYVHRYRTPLGRRRGVALPMNARVCRIGVQACLALYRAAAYGEPHCGAVVTVAGDAVATPQNLYVPFGTPVQDLLHHCGLSEDPNYLILGDMMTGVAAESAELPVLPGMTCILALKKRPVFLSPTVCIGCGRCAKVCHAGLLPSEIVRRLENMHYERLAGLHPEDCDGCGACSYVCPSGREVALRVTEAAHAHGTIFLDWGEEDEA